MITKKEIACLESLLYIYAISKSKSKREVAERLGTSVDTINKYVSEFESEMKTRFLLSNGRGTAITPEGKKILDISEDIVRVLRSLGDYGERAASYKGTVRLAMPDTAADYLGAKGVFEFLTRYPEISFENMVSNVVPDMGVMEADICLDFAPPSHPDAVVIAEKPIRCGFFASRRYIEVFGRPRNVEDLMENHRICFKESNVIKNPKVREVFACAKHVVYKTSSVFSLRSVLRAGLGVGLCPLSYGDANLLHLKNLKLDFDITLYLFAHKDGKDMPRNRLVLDYIKNLMNGKEN